MCRNDLSEYELEMYEDGFVPLLQLISSIKKGKFVITPCKVSKDNLKQAHKRFELNGLAVLPTCWV